MGLAGCGAANPGLGSKAAAGPSAPDTERVASVVPGSDRTFVLVAGWMPSGRGFAITARRYTWRSRSYVALSASIVGRARTRAAIEREVIAGAYGSTQLNIASPSATFVPTGLVDCSAHPAVLLFAWVAPGVRASLHEGGVAQTLSQAAGPPALGLPSGVLLYGPQTQAAKLIQPSAPSESLSPPPPPRSCRNATETITYLFGRGGAPVSSSGMG